MQGYKKFDEEREFADKVESFLMSNHIFFIKNYAPQVDEYSNPDYVACINGRFVCLELNNYLHDPSVKLGADKIKSIQHAKGTLIMVNPTNFSFVKDAIKHDLESHVDFRKKKGEVIGMNKKSVGGKPSGAKQSSNRSGGKFQKKGAAPQKKSPVSPSQTKFERQDNRFNRENFNRNMNPFKR